MPENIARRRRGRRARGRRGRGCVIDAVAQTLAATGPTGAGRRAAPRSAAWIVWSTGSDDLDVERRARRAARRAGCARRRARRRRACRAPRRAVVGRRGTSRLATASGWSNGTQPATTSPNARRALPTAATSAPPTRVGEAALVVEPPRDLRLTAGRSTPRRRADCSARASPSQVVSSCVQPSNDAGDSAGVSAHDSVDRGAWVRRRPGHRLRRRRTVPPRPQIRRRAPRSRLATAAAGAVQPNGVRSTARRCR